MVTVLRHNSYLEMMSVFHTCFCFSYLFQIKSFFGEVLRKAFTGLDVGYIVRDNFKHVLTVQAVSPMFC